MLSYEIDYGYPFLGICFSLFSEIETRNAPLDIISVMQRNFSMFLVCSTEDLLPTCTMIL